MSVQGALPIREGSTLKPRQCLAGVADLGTTLPIILALAATTGISAPRMFVVIGLANLFTGLRYRLPIPVQPLKAVAAIVIANDLPAAVLPATAAATAIVMLVASFTPMRRWLAASPMAFIRGLQFAVGGFLVLAALRMLGWAGAATTPTVDRGGSILLLVVVLLGSQLPVTLSNAIAGTASLARDTFGARNVATVPALMRSTGMINVLAAVLGGVPMCHGSSGFTAYRMWGARTGAATITLGTVFVAGGLIAGDAITAFAHAIPAWLLAAGLALTGGRHALLMLDRRGTDLAIALAIGTVAIVSSEMLFGLAAGLGLVAVRALIRTLRLRPVGEPA